MLSSSEHVEDPFSPAQTGQTASTREDEPMSFSHIRTALQQRGAPLQARDPIRISWRSTTMKRYITKWILFCGQNVNPLQPSINQVLKFLSQLYITKDYSTGLFVDINRSAISTFLKICSNIDINSCEEIIIFMKGVFFECPALPRYTITRDVSKALRYLQTLTNTNLPLLTYNYYMLYLLLSAQRCQTVHAIELSD